MPAKQLSYNQEAQGKMLNGVQQLAKAVKSTLGPCGRNVAIARSFGSPLVTKDGVTVAKEIELTDAYENMGAQMVKEVASKTSSDSGDGTTTATIYAEAIYSEGLKNVAAGAEPMDLKRGIMSAVEAIVDELQKMQTPIKSNDQIAQIGTCAANQNSEIGSFIAHAMDKVGKDGVITIEEGKSLDSTVELVEGMQFDKGYISPHFMNNGETLCCDLEKPVVLIHEKKITNGRELIPLLEQIAKTGKQLLIIAEDIEGEALTLLAVNKLRGALQVCAVKAPGFGDRRKSMLEDIAIFCGCTPIMESLGTKLENINVSDLGTVKKAKITKDNCTLVDGGGKPADIKARISQIKTEISSTTSDYDKEKLQERLAKLSGGIAELRIGAATEIELKEKKALVEDALHACRAAVEEGIVPGGGVAILRASKVLDALSKKLRGDQRTGVDIVKRAIAAPIKQIATNAGLDGSIVYHNVMMSTEQNYGFNALTGEYGDMIKMGVPSPKKVERVALQNAASVASLLLTTSCIIADLPQTEEKNNPHGGPGYDM